MLSRPWARGDPITAARLNSMVAKEPGKATPAQSTTVAVSPGEGVAPSTGASATVWQEISRTTTTVRVENPGDPTQYVDVDRIDTVTLADGAGNTMTLVFTGA